MDVPTSPSLEGEFHIDQAPLILSFHLSGYGLGEIFQGPGRKAELPCEPGKVLLSFNPDSCCRTHSAPGDRFKALNLYVDPTSLAEQLGSDLSTVPKALRPLIENAAQTPFNAIRTITPATRMILEQIYNCPYQGRLAELFMECKATELLLRQLWESSQDPAPQGPQLAQEDRRRLFQARDLLMQHMEDPPPLKTLAHLVGLNDTKLKRGFRALFGTSVYGYLREQRMEKAKEFLHSGTMNVDETALALGFHDTAHFIRQFKQNFGTTPGTYLKQLRSMAS